MLEDYTNLIFENSAKTIYPGSQNETNFSSNSTGK